MITNKGPFFIADTHVRRDPSAPEIAEIALMCAAHVRRFGIEPKIALVSHSDFGSDDTPSTVKMRDALEILRERAPDLEADGEMQANTALSQAMRDLVLPASRLKGEANVLVMPNLDAANIAYTMTMIMADTQPVANSSRHGQTRPHPDAFGDSARHHQYDRGLGRPSARRELNRNESESSSPNRF